VKSWPSGSVSEENCPIMGYVLSALVATLSAWIEPTLQLAIG
jgi:hypothetical protein